MKILFLLPPSEGKNSEGNSGKEVLSYDFEKPKNIAKNATQKDLKCIGNRYEEGMNLNIQHMDDSHDNVVNAMNRYTGVMFNAIDYADMQDAGQEYFDEHFMIFSGMYGIVKPRDIIGNYKLPIETKGLVAYWKESITKTLNESQVDYIVNLLPLSYMKKIDFKTLVPKLVNINFQTEKDGKVVKISHGVKKIKGEWIKDVCEKLGTNKNADVFDIFGGEKIKTDKSIEVNILHK